jgi:hypothetical protein
MTTWANAGRAWNLVWPIVAGTAIALGLAISMRDPGPIPALALFLAAATLGGTCLLTWSGLTLQDEVSMGRTAVGAAVVGLLCVAFAGLAVPSAAWALGVVLTLGLTWPGWPALARRAISRQRGGADVASATPNRVPSDRVPSDRAPVVPDAVWQPVPLTEHVALTIPDTLQDDDLCLAWCSSYVALERATSWESRLRVVRLRALYLDEMERRNPAALGEWLESGARAASHPRALTRGERRAAGPEPERSRVPRRRT